MKSGLRRLTNLTGGKPPIPLSPPGYGSASLRFPLIGGPAGMESYLRTYGRSGTVFSIVSLLAESTATPNWHLYKRRHHDRRVRYTTGDQGSDQRTEIIQHAALKLWNEPNTFHTRFEFCEGAQQHEELTGETFWVLDRENGLNFPTSLWYVRPDRMTPIPSPDDFLVGWIYTGPNGESVPLQRDEVILEKRCDPLDPYRGMGPVASIQPNIEQQRYATEFQRNLFINGADPGGIITVPNKLSEAEFDELVAHWREGHQGIARAGKVGVLENGATWAPGGQSNKDLEYGNLRAVNRDELREAWRIHKHMLGTVDDVNRANAVTAKEDFNDTLVIPRLNRRRDTLNSKLLPMFGATGSGIEFDYEPPKQLDREQDNLELQTKCAGWAALVNAGADPHDAAEVVGLPDMAVTEQIVGTKALPPRWTPTEVDEEPLPTKYGAEVDAAQPTARQRIEISGQRREVLDERDTASKVFEQQAEDYPPDAMGWMHHAMWKGPAVVPLDHIQPNMRWLDTASPDHVADFVKRIQKGKKLKPVILVKTPGDPDLQLVDGHHRYLAAAETSQPLRAYIGTVHTEHGDWESMHDYQIDRWHSNTPTNHTDDVDWDALTRLLQTGLRPITARALPAHALNRRRHP